MNGRSDTPERILGIDPGSRQTGFGIIDCDGFKSRYVASGAVQCARGSLPERLELIYSSVRRIVTDYSPQTVVIESVFMHRNAGSALKLGQARAAALCATFGKDIPVYEYAPREIKLAVVGRGGAQKEQVQHMVASLLALDGMPSADASDALAAALCHAHHRHTRSRLASAALAAGKP